MDKKDNVVRVRMTAHEAVKLKAFAEKRGTSVSHVLREYVRRLPNPSQSLQDI